MLNKTFGCCRFIYNKILEKRLKVYEELKGDNQADKEWTCLNCHTNHHRDINASENIEQEGKGILRENNIKIIRNNDTAIGTTVNAFGEDLRLSLGEQFSMNYESIAL
ncbi:MAG: helix-turn-helix domain-containing protein [Candidatus Lokiarchaeota archaeon]|nr:helix-turn-helix domain-containing protein [Candidatus Lokiarchaeota archaeon]